MNDSHPNFSNYAHYLTGELVPFTTSAVARRGYGQTDWHQEYASSGAEKFRANLREYWRIFKKWKWIILTIIAVVTGLGALRTLTMIPMYTAMIRLQIDRNVSKVVEGGNVMPVEGADYEFLRTQYELLQSRSVAERAASALKLGDDADFLKPREYSIRDTVRRLTMFNPSSVVENDKSVGRAELQEASVGVILSNRLVRPITGSRLVDITYSDTDPERAQRIVTALADAFIASNLDKRFQANAYAKAFLEDHLKQLQSRLQDSENAALEFGKKEQIIGTTEKSSIAENNLAAANATLGNLVSERIKNEQLWKQVESANAISLPQFLSNKVIEGLRDKRNTLVTQYQEKLQTFKPSYPAMVQINNQVREVDRQLAAEVGTIKAALRGAYQASVSQENQMKGQIESLRAEVLDLQRRGIQYNILKREADTNRSLYESLLQRYKEVDIAGGVGANNIFIVDKAELPTSPSSPHVSRDLVLSLLFGFALGLGAAFVLERLDDTVNSVEEVERLTGLATLGAIPKVGRGRTIEKELADLWSPATEAYRSLCAALHFATESGLPKTLFVTSSSTSEGKSTTAIAVARRFANIGLRVLLIDGDLRDASLHLKLNLRNSVGLTNYLTGRCTASEAFQNTNTPNLTFMASGPLPPNAADLLSSSRLLSLLSVGIDTFDFIVFDGPPVMGLADAQLLSGAAAATIFMVGAGKARKGVVRNALKRLQFARGSIIGAVLTRHDSKNADYGYGYGFGHESPRNRALTEGEGDHLQLTSDQCSS
ncbi:capsular exopolysaccharide family [Rhizobiales bacterium GAS188]|nr:capsular exopolysaccharide family [Rhizobiales bacterium GAS188]